MTPTFIFVLFLCSAVFPTYASPQLNPTTRSSTCPIRLDHDPPASSRYLLQGPVSTDKLTNISTLSQFSDHAVTPRIVNGDILSPNLVPYMVTLLGVSICTGTLISPSWFISAAHCQISIGDEVRISSPNRDFGSRDFLRIVSAAYPHPRYNTVNGGDYDFAAIQISIPASPSESKFMRVNVNPDIPKSRSYSRVMGYGVLEFQGDTDGNARQVDVPVTSESSCTSAYPIVRTQRQFCAGYVKSGGCDSCGGDSGGPIIQYTAAGEPILIGVVSFGKECALSGFPGVYVKTSAFASYLDQLGIDYHKATDVEEVLQSGLSNAAIAGIVVACLLLATVVIIGSIWFMRKRRAFGDAAQTSPPAPGPTLGPGGAPAPPPSQPGSLGQYQMQPGYPASPQVGAAVPVYPATPPTYTATQPMQTQQTPPTYPGAAYTPVQTIPMPETSQTSTVPAAPAPGLNTAEDVVITSQETNPPPPVPYLPVASQTTEPPK